MDGIYHVVRAFDNPKVTHVSKKIDPVTDMENISIELILKDLDMTEKLIDN